MEMTSAMLLNYLSGFPRMLVIASIPFFLPMQKKDHWYVHLFSLVGLLGACMGIGYFLFPRVFPAIPGAVFFGFYYLTSICCVAATIHLMCGSTWIESIYVGLFSYLTQHTLHCISTLSSYLMRDASWWNETVTHYVFMVILYTAIYFLFTRVVCADGHYDPSLVRSAGLLFVEFIMMYAMSIAVSDMGLDWLHSAYALICISFIFISERQWLLQTRLEKELQAKEQIWSVQQTQYELTRENIDIINRKCHDLRHQLDAMRTVATEEDRLQTMEAMRQAVRIYDTSYQTGNASLDTVLMQKGLVCHENGITLSVIADGRLLDFINPVDLYTMMANVLDNAIEANRKIDDPNLRSIHLKIHEIKGLTILQAENPFQGEVRMENGFPVTSKEDVTRHGIGTHSITATAEQYGGTVKITAQDGMFLLRLIFPAREHTNQDEKMSFQDKCEP